MGQRPRRDGRAAAGGTDGRADRADPANPRLLRARRRQRLLGQPARDWAGSWTGSPPPPWSPSRVQDQLVATHERVWSSGATVTDPEHKATARGDARRAGRHPSLAAGPPAPTHRRARRGHPRAAGLRRPLRRPPSTQPSTPPTRADIDADPVGGAVNCRRAPWMTSTKTAPTNTRNTTAASFGARLEAGLPEQGVEDPHDRPGLGRPRRAGAGAELAARGVSDRSPRTPGRRTRVRRHHDACPHRPLPFSQDAGGVQPRAPAQPCAATCSPTWPPPRSSRRPTT